MERKIKGNKIDHKKVKSRPAVAFRFLNLIWYASISTSIFFLLKSLIVNCFLDCFSKSYNLRLVAIHIRTTSSHPSRQTAFFFAFWLDVFKTIRNRIQFEDNQN